jgi:hypothetical protein
MVNAETGFYRKAQKLCTVLLHNYTRYNRMKYARQTATKATTNQPSTHTAHEKGIIQLNSELNYNTEKEVLQQCISCRSFTKTILMHLMMAA